MEQTIEGTLFSVARISRINIESLGTWHHVLHVPKLFVNLFYIHRVAKLDEYTIIFDDVDAFLCNKV